jgi:DHA2 family multidrug resistance protein-like MFS transporter
MRSTAEASLAGALEVAAQLPQRAGEALTVAAQTAFNDGIRTACTVGIVLSLLATWLTYRFLPRTLAPRGPLQSAEAALENAAEFGVGGAMPIFPDTAESDVPSPA